MTKTKQTKKPDKKQWVTPNSSVTITLDWKTVAPEFQKAVKKHAKNLKLPGFRAGKAPLELAEKKLDLQTLADEVIQALVPARFQTELEKAKKKSISKPRVKTARTEKNKPWEIVLDFAERPEVSVKGFEKLVKKANEKFKKEHKKPEDKNQNNATEHEHDHSDQHRLQHIMADLVKEYAPEIQEALLQEEVDRKLQELAQHLQSAKMQFEDFLKNRKQDAESFLREVQAESLAALQVEFILQAITQEKKLSVSDKDIEAEIAKIPDERAKKLYTGNKYYQEMLKNNLLRQKTIDSLLKL